MKTFSSNLSKQLLIPALLLLAGCVGSAHLLEGNETLDYLDSEEEIALEFDYEDARVGGYASEEKYIEAKTEQKEEEEKGSGEEWEKEWRSNKSGTYEPTFRKKLNEVVEKRGIQFVEGEDTDYIATLKVKKMEPGYFGGVVSEEGKVSTNLEFSKKGEKDDPLTVLRKNQVPGAGYSAWGRLKAAFHQSATYYGNYIKEHFEGP